MNNQLIYNVKHFFTLGYFSEYLIYGVGLGLFCGAYLYFRLGSLQSYRGRDRSGRKERGVRLAAAGIAFLCSLNIWSFAALLVFYIVICSLAADVICWLITHLLKQTGRTWFRSFWKYGGMGFLLFAVLIGYSAWNFHHIVRTEISLKTEKAVDDFRVLLISDVHYASVHDPQLIADSIDRINAENADVILLDGDIVDDRTTKAEMEKCFRVLGGLKAKGGVYYVFGNHDLQPYGTDRDSKEPVYTKAELTRAIESNGIRALEDQGLRLEDHLYLIGRSDYGWDGVNRRASMKGLMDSTEAGDYIIVADHQPETYPEYVEAGADLQLSGHTHAGQVFPFNVMYYFMGLNNYGRYRHGDMDLVVTSGFGGWGYPIRNVAHCEYMVVDIDQ